MTCQLRIRTPAAVLPAALWLAAACALNGCSDGGPAYPSLASRPAERLNDTAQPDSPGPAAANVPDVPPGPPSADLAARLDHLVQQARSGYRAFAAKRAGAETAVSGAGGAAVGSEQWARGTQALSGLQSARSLTAQPLADLDRIEIDDRLAHPAQSGPDGTPPPRPDAVAIAQARDTVSALLAEEDAVLGKLDGRLKR